MFITTLHSSAEECPEIPQTDGMAISYTSDQNIGSIAAFHCLQLHVRTGVSHTTCKQNGEWKDPIPTCALPTCLVDSLFKIVPENVVPDMNTVPSENVPFNSTITLTCEKGLKLSGPNKAKCGPNGVWQVSKVKCVAGCPYPVSSHDSDLIIDPNKDQYRLGELVTLSCPAEELFPVLGEFVALVGGQQPAPRVSQTCSIGFMSGEHAGHSIRTIPSSKRESYTRSEDLIPISASSQRSISNDVEVCAPVKGDATIHQHSSTAKSDTFVHERRIIPTSTVPPDEIRLLSG
ncbi:protein lev-9 [Trichonephila clavipes]|nr:protein lev-9 [Trichonephila clavipes]